VSGSIRAREARWPKGSHTKKRSLLWWLLLVAAGHVSQFWSDGDALSQERVPAFQ
jgi:hypothetical protein